MTKSITEIFPHNFSNKILKNYLPFEIGSDVHTQRRENVSTGDESNINYSELSSKEIDLREEKNSTHRVTFSV